MTPTSDPIATLRRHAESHRALAASDAYSAQEAPRLDAALADVQTLIEAGTFATCGGACQHNRCANLRAALARFTTTR